MNKEGGELYLKWMAQRESTQGTKFQELIESDKEEITVADLMELIITDDKEIKRLREGIKRIAKLAVQRNARHTEKALLELIE